jgi:predicted RNA-binding protein with PIN domain
MRYLIDGYNLLFKLSTPAKSPLEKKRLLLISELNEVVSLLKLNATIVFDGSMPLPATATRQHFDALEIVYTTAEQNADAYIIKEVELARRPSQITVITSDRSLTMQCRSLGAQAKSIHDFLAFIHKKKTKKRRISSPATEGAFRDSETQIARYLKIFEKKITDEE